VPAQGLLKRMLRGMRAEPRMVGVVRRAKAQGIRTALLSNSWGLGYDRAGWDSLFDEVVISGEVGLRKPEPEIYLLVAGRLGARPDECVFVDDLPANVHGAVATGMVGIHHTNLDQTISELEILFRIHLADDARGGWHAQPDQGA
jgi:epoxide hydrolase-like predicted phosphatase